MPESCLHRNSKTGLSCDFTTICRRTRAGAPCFYCYVACGRAAGRYAKKVVDYAPYDGFALRMRAATIKRMNAVGGLRLFSFADYLTQHDKDISALLDDASSVGLKIKAITKETDFIKRYHDHPAIAVIHASIDLVKGKKEGRSPITHSEARRLRSRYAKVLIRAVAIDWDDVRELARKDIADIVTLNHAVFPKSHGKTFHLFSHEERRVLSSMFPGRVCASGKSGHCRDCPVHCGVPHLLERKMHEDAHHHNEPRP